MNEHSISRYRPKLKSKARRGHWPMMQPVANWDFPRLLRARRSTIDNERPADFSRRISAYLKTPLARRWDHVDGAAPSDRGAGLAGCAAGTC